MDNVVQARGHDTSRHVLACFGGAGGQHACAIARALGIGSVYIHKSVSLQSRLFLCSLLTSLRKPLLDIFWFLHCLAVQCIVIGPVCVQWAGGRCVFVALWVCYHDNSKLCSSIFTKLGLSMKVVTISSWLNFGRPAPLEGVCGVAYIFGSALLQPVRSVCISPSAFSFVDNSLPLHFP